MKASIALHPDIFDGLQSVEREECMEDVEDGLLTDMGPRLAEGVEETEGKLQCS